MWMKGKDLTRRPDEPERRALAGLLMLEERPDLRHLHHYAAQAILELPEGHPRRDAARARKAVLDELAWFKEQSGDTPWVSLAAALAVAYRERFGTDEELSGWEEWAATAAPNLDPRDALHMWTALEGYYLERSETDAERWLPEVQRIRALIEALPMTPRLRAESFLSAARFYTRSDDQRQIAVLYRQALETDSLDDHLERMIATMEARLRMGTGETERVVEYSPPGSRLTKNITSRRSGTTSATMPVTSTRRPMHCWRWRWRNYTAGLKPSKRSNAASAFASDTPWPCADARCGEAAGPRSGIVRPCHGVSRRRPTEAVEQVHDWFAQGLSPEAKFREQYRKLLPGIERHLPTPPTLAEICRPAERRSRPFTWTWWPGTMAALLVTGEAEPVWTCLRDDITQSVISAWLGGGEGENEEFLLALERGVSAVDPRPALARLLSNLDPVFGEPVAAAMKLRGLDRLVVLPHDFLRLAPLWALKSWESLDVRTGAGRVRPNFKSQACRSWPRSHCGKSHSGPAAGQHRSTRLAAGRLAGAGLQTQTLAGPEATEEALCQALERSSLLHFAGHGIASMTDSSMSALLLHADWEKDAPGGRGRVTRDGRCHAGESATAGGPRRRFTTAKAVYQYARSGTIYAEAEHDTVLISGELWRAGDILVQGELRECALAFLCACSSGLGSIERLEKRRDSRPHWK